MFPKCLWRWSCRLRPGLRSFCLRVVISRAGGFDAFSTRMPTDDDNMFVTIFEWSPEMFCSRTFSIQLNFVQAILRFSWVPV